MNYIEPEGEAIFIPLLLVAGKAVKGAVVVAKVAAPAVKGAIIKAASVVKAAGAKVVSAAKAVGTKAVSVGKTAAAQAVSLGKAVGVKTVSLAQAAGTKAVSLAKTVGSKVVSGAKVAGTKAIGIAKTIVTSSKTAIGAATGGIADIVGQVSSIIINPNKTFRDFSVKQVIASISEGAFMGALGGTGAIGKVGLGIWGAGASTVNYLTTTPRSEWDLGEWAISAGVSGGVSGFFAGELDMAVLGKEFGKSLAQDLGQEGLFLVPEIWNRLFGKREECEVND